MLIPLILSGGSGTRLWPLSRKNLPKQFLPLADKTKTLFQQTLARVASVADQVPGTAAPMIVCSDDHRFIVAEQLRTELDQPATAILLEPVARNTAPAIVVAALHALSIDPHACLLVLPADHLVSDTAAFVSAISDAQGLVDDGQLVTFGITPTGPETGFGYIKRGSNLTPRAFIVEAFFEKPSLEAAQQYVNEGIYDWNAGIFMFKASALLEQVSLLAPALLAPARAALENAKSDMDFIRLELESFATCEDISIDYAVMEKTESAVVIPMDCGWNDIGSWSALWEISQKDENSNHFQGDVLAHDSKKNLIIAHDKHLVATVGIEDLIIISTPDATLVAARDRVQEIKKIIESLSASNRKEHLYHRKVYRPWGSYDTVDLGDRFQVKRIVVKPGASLSSQMHFHRAEHWIVVSGTAEVTRDGEKILLAENQSTYLPLGCVHRLTNPGKLNLELIEVQSGSYLGEDDIVRFDDVYGRT
ncbi:mannose-1-phosphate guanylyltransferase/mannose-6-phosphate isomerase [Pseudomonas sp. TE3610]